MGREPMSVADWVEELDKLASLDAGPDVLVCEALLKVAPRDDAVAREWESDPKAKARSLMVASDMYKEQLGDAMMKCIKTLWDEGDEREGVEFGIEKAIAKISARAESTALAKAAQDVALYVLGGGLRPDGARIALEHWGECELGGPIKRLVAEADWGEAGPGARPFTIEESQVGALADCLNLWATLPCTVKSRASFAARGVKVALDASLPGFKLDGEEARSRSLAL